MKKYLLLLLIAFPQFCSAQKKAEPIYNYVDIMPEFRGGNEKLMEFIASNLVYPDSAIEANLQGKVLVSFVVDSKGNVRDIVVIKGLSKECDEECIRVIKKMPKWKPGTQNGKAVSVKYLLPISFKLKN